MSSLLDDKNTKYKAQTERMPSLIFKVSVQEPEQMGR